MHHQNTVLHALIKTLPRWRFDALARRHRADHRVRTLDSWSQLTALIFAQLAGSPSLRELVQTLASHGRRLYHLGSGTVRRSTLADANAKRPAALFADIFALLLGRLAPALAREAGEAVRLLDATSLRLSALSSWAAFSACSHGAKLHVVFDPAARLPTYFAITPARINDIVVAKRMPIEPDATYVFDLGYYDFGFWAELDAAGCRLVTRLKRNSPLAIVRCRPSADPTILADREVRLSERLANSRRNPYGGVLREIVVRIDPARTLRLVTNDLEAPASEIAELYRTRWQIELFFRWVKQNLRIKKFLGTSENAVRIQIICALLAYLLLRLAQAAWPTRLSLQALARLVRANLMHRKTIPELLHPPPRRPVAKATPQLALALRHARL